MNVTLHLTSDYFVAGVVIRDGVVVKAAPIVKYLKGWSLEKVIDRANTKLWHVLWLEDEQQPIQSIKGNTTMSLTNVQEVKQKREYPLPKKGLRLGVLTGIVDVGIQAREFKGKAKAPARMVIFQYSLVKDTYEDDEGNTRHIKVSDGPFTLSPGADKGKYMAHCSALDPEREVLSANCAGDITKLLGRGAYLTIVHSEPKPDGKVYANIDGVSQLPEDVVVPSLPLDFLLFDTSNPTAEAVERLSSYQKDTIRKSQGFAGSKLEKMLEAVSNGEAPANVNDQQDDNNDEDSPI